MTTFIPGTDGIQLLFLNESQLQETFGSHIRHGVEVILVTAAELRDAKEMEDEEQILWPNGGMVFGTRLGGWNLA